MKQRCERWSRLLQRRRRPQRRVLSARGQGTYRLFETSRGGYEPHPSLEFDVDWDRADLADSGVISWLVIFLLAAFALVVINDLAAALRAKRDGDRPDS